MTGREHFDIENERAMLCAMLREPTCIEAVASISVPADLSQAHQPIFLRLFELWRAGGNPDLVTVAHALREHGELEAVGGPEYLTGLLDMGAIGANARSYASIIRKKADARAAAAAIKAALKRVSNGNGAGPQQAIGELIQELQAIHGAAASDGPRDYQNLAGKIREYLGTIDGTFFTHQIFSDLGIKEPRDKTNVRQILKRFKGNLIQSQGNQAGCWRVIRGEVEKMNLQNGDDEELNLWLPLDLHNYVQIMSNNLIVITGDPDSGKTAFMLRTIKENLGRWNCHYFNSEMGAFELRKRLDLFAGFPIEDPHFHAYERSDCFEDVVQPGKYVLNVIDYLEITEEFYLISKHLANVYKNLHGSVALIAIQKRCKTSDLPLGAQRALEKPRLAISLSAGSKTTPNIATIIKCKNRKTLHSMIGHTRTFKLIAGCEFRSDSPLWS